MQLELRLGRHHREGDLQDPGSSCNDDTCSPKSLPGKTRRQGDRATDLDRQLDLDLGPPQTQGPDHATPDVMIEMT
ncbi:MAG: hypothetical protein KGR26_04400 [Cyanobacteria bacterium REEB65]|nr:hypothetical protein [Cyanobacteria bacterium REEB65]